MKTFLESPEFGSEEDNARPHNKNVLIDIFDKGTYEEVLYIAGIGSGKSFLASKAIEFIIYNLLCLKNPQRFFHFAKGTRIAFVNISRSFTQAKDVVFGEIKNRIDNNPWFQRYYPPDPRIKSKIRLPKSIFILPIGSNEESPLGYNIFGAVIDEASFHTATADKDYAEESYNQIKKRIRSRFLDRGRLFIITSPKYVYDFAERKFAEDENPKLYKLRTPLWDALPAEMFSGEKFDLGDYLESFKGIMVPVEYELEFKSNPEKAMRDYGAQPSLAIQGFFRDPGIIIERSARDRKHPVDKRSGDFFEWFYNPSGAENYDSDPRYIHVDLGLNKAGKGCATGICMGKFDGWQEVKTPDGKIEKRARIWIDYMEQITAGPKEEIMFKDIRRKIYRLREIGYNIKLVTFDSWNSRDSIQMLNETGIKADVFSVDRKPEAYHSLKGGILEKRISYYDYPVFIRECQQLEEIKGTKIDHPRAGSKDVSDAFAAVCWHCSQGKPGRGLLGA